jgi:hypothetical protein
MDYRHVAMPIPMYVGQHNTEAANIYLFLEWNLNP